LENWENFGKLGNFLKTRENLEKAENFWKSWKFF